MLSSHVGLLWKIWCCFFTSTLNNILLKTESLCISQAQFGVVWQFPIHDFTSFHLTSFFHPCEYCALLLPKILWSDFFPLHYHLPTSTMFVSINNQTDGNLWYFSGIESAMSGKVGLTRSLWGTGEFPLMHFCSFYVFHRKCSIFLSLC